MFKCIAVAATLGALVFTGVAQATPRPTFTATNTVNGVSLYAPPFVGCGYAPCSYAFKLLPSGVTLGLGRSVVTQQLPGCYEFQLRMTERTFRNPTPASATTERFHCVL